MDTSDAVRALELIVEGPGVGPARISLSDLSDIANAVQKAVRQIGSVAKTGVGYARGGLTAELELATRLELTALLPGSAALLLDFPVEIERSVSSPDVGLVAVNRLVSGINEVNNGVQTPSDWDDSVFRALEGVGRSVGRGRVESVVVRRPGGPTARYSVQTRERIRNHLATPRSVAFETFRGRLMMVDFDVDRRRCRIEQSDGLSIESTFPIDLVGELRENTMRFVEVAGYAERGPTGSVRRLSILRLSPLRTPSGAIAEVPLRGIEEVVRAQGITSASARSLIDQDLWQDTEEVDRFLQWVQDERSAPL